MKLLDLLIGRKLANREGESEKITAIEGVPAMGLDGLASSAYGPEAALTMLAPLRLRLADTLGRWLGLFLLLARSRGAGLRR